MHCSAACSPSTRMPSSLISPSPRIRWQPLGRNVVVVSRAVQSGPATPHQPDQARPSEQAGPGAGGKPSSPSAARLPSATMMARRLMARPRLPMDSGSEHVENCNPSQRP